MTRHHKRYYTRFCAFHRLARVVLGEPLGTQWAEEAIFVETSTREGKVKQSNCKFIKLVSEIQNKHLLALPLLAATSLRECNATSEMWSGTQRGTGDGLGGDAVQVTHMDSTGVSLPLLELGVEVPFAVQAAAAAQRILVFIKVDGMRPCLILNKH